MPKTIMYVKGVDGQVELTTDRVVVHREGLFNTLKYGRHASHEIPLSSVSGIDFHDATFFTMGEIDFDHPGKMSDSKGKKNAVKFNKRHQKEFHALKEKIFQIIEYNHRQHR